LILRLLSYNNTNQVETFFYHPSEALLKGTAFAYVCIGFDTTMIEYKMVSYYYFIFFGGYDDE
jgi:hypothetical protein